MRIAWTGPVAPTGGVPGMGMLMLRELLRQGVEVDVYLTGDRTGPPPVKPAPGLRVIVVQTGWRWGRWYSRTKPGALFSGLAVRSLSGILLSIRLLVEHRRNPYDAVFQLSQMELFLLGRLSRLAPPIVVHPCTHAAGELRWHRAEQAYALRSERRSFHMIMRAWLELRSRLQPKELARADLVVGPSNRYNHLLHDDYGVPLEKLRVLRHPVDLERFSPNGAGDQAHPRKLLFVSRMSSRKGVAEIVELSNRLTDLSDSVRLLAIGGCTQWSDYRAHMSDLNPKVAEYLPGVPTEEMPALLRSGTMLLVPSRYEPGSIVTGEALACGLPVVMSDQVGPSEVVAGPHVRVHRAGDVDSLERAVRSLLDAVEQDEPTLRAAARANAEEQFAATTVIARLIELVSTLSPRATRPPAFPDSYERHRAADADGYTRPAKLRDGARLGAQTSTAELAVKVARALPVDWLRSVNQWMHRSERGRAVLDVIWTRVGEVPVTIPRGPLTGWRFASGGGQPGYLLGASEPDLQNALVRCIGPGDTVYDIGANVGFFTLLAARLASAAGRVYAFEPMPINLRALTRNVQLNGLGHVEVVPSAVSDTCGPVVMSSGNNQATGHIVNHHGPGLITLACTTVDAFVAAGHRPPDVVKIDVEGAEDRVISGMAQTLMTHRPIILCELHFGPDDPRRTTISHVFAGAGYTETPLALDRGSMAHLLAEPAEYGPPGRLNEHGPEPRLSGHEGIAPRLPSERA